MAALDKMPLDVMPETAEETVEESTTVDETAQNAVPKNRNSIFEQWTDKFKEFLDKA